MLTHYHRCIVLVTLASSLFVSPAPGFGQDCLEYGDFMHRTASLDLEYSEEAVTVVDDYAYVTHGSKLSVIDITDFRTPVVTGTVSLGSLQGKDIAVANGFAFVPTWDGDLAVVDISDPNNPERVALCSLPGRGMGIDVVGSYAYLACHDSGFHIFDIADPLSPQLVGSVDTSGQARHVYVSGTHAYVSDLYGGLLVIDVANPATPAIVGSDSNLTAMAVTGDGNFVYVASAWFGLRVYDVSQPTAPEMVGTLSTPDVDSPWHLALAGDLLYLTSGGDGLAVIDVADPSGPEMLGIVLYPNHGTGDVAVSGNAAFVIARILNVFDVTNPKSPPGIADLDGPFARYWQGDGGMALTGHYAIVVSGWVESGFLRSIDISDPAAPFLAGTTADTLGAPTDVEVVGDFGYVTDGWGALRVVDLQDPADPALIASANIPGVPSDVIVNGEFAYVACWDYGVSVVDVVDPGSPSFLGEFETGTPVMAVAIAENFLYVLDNTNELHVFDLNLNPVLPTWVTSITVHSWYGDLTVAGDKIYIPTESHRLQVVDIADPTAPFLTASLDILGKPERVEVMDGIAYLADIAAGLLVVDINDPTQPRWLGTVPIRDAYQVAVRDDHVYLLTEDRFLVFRPQCDVVSGLTLPPSSTAAIRLLPNYPNPFNPATTVAFDLASTQHVLLEIFSLDGRRVTTLLDEPRHAGHHEIVWRGLDSLGREVSSGVYLARLATALGVRSVKMVNIQ